MIGLGGQRPGIAHEAIDGCAATLDAKIRLQSGKRVSDSRGGGNPHELLDHGRMDRQVGERPVIGLLREVSVPLVPGQVASGQPADSGEQFLARQWPAAQRPVLAPREQ